MSKCANETAIDDQQPVRCARDQLFDENGSRATLFHGAVESDNDLFVTSQIDAHSLGLTPIDRFDDNRVPEVICLQQGLVHGLAGLTGWGWESGASEECFGQLLVFRDGDCCVGGVRGGHGVESADLRAGAEDEESWIDG